MYDNWMYEVLEHDCPTCGLPLLKVDTSKLVTCSDVNCKQEPLFLIPEGA